MPDVAGLPDGLTVRAARMDDADVVADLLIACERHDGGLMPDVDVSDVLAAWQRPGADLASVTALVYDGARLVAFAEVIDGSADVAVAVGHRGRGVGSALARFVARVARDRGTREVHQIVPDGRADAVPLLVAHGYTRRWTSWTLDVDVTAATRPAPPAGYVIEPFARERDEREVFDVVDGAFSEWPGREPAAFGDWWAFAAGHARFAPALSPVARHGDRIVGAAVSLDFGTEAWVHQLAVAADHRRRGLGRALLEEVFGLARDAGHTTVALSTDSRTGALTLYEHLGMRVRRSYTRWSTKLDPA